MDPNATVLRVKRKRGTDPADALLLACKRIRPETPPSSRETGPEPDEAEVENSVFKLVATVDTQDAPVKTHIEQAFARPRMAHALRPSAASAQRIVGDLRSTKWCTRREERYRIVSGHRTGLSSPAEQQKPRADAPERVKQAGKEQDKCWVLGQIQVVDLLHETEEDQNESPGKVTTDPEAILCNNVKMLREHLSISGETRGETRGEARGQARGETRGETRGQARGETDYVYDLYYQEAVTPGWIQDILSVRAYANEGELVPDLVVQEEVYDDEDDENDEANWRNDYPDEDDSASEAEERYVGHWEEEEHSYSRRKGGGRCSDDDGDGRESD
ncbi:probable RNA polymerase II nuclear localization protein SLC7A6OS [Brachionichthys hirsutus]|uniref:probable RNA polymerase II nuclear localization protein SLC7A6OS n=1 Tax=Brachionichthys hirsutus TaxID=412623 RepID=UPI0036053405